jgi:sugar/nucleoside kinase (ribokinase family)
MIATRYQDRELFAGGVFAAANHLSSFCRQVDILTCLGGGDSHEEFIREHLQPNVRMTVVERPGAPTTLKRRFIDPSYMRKLFEVYLMDDEPLTGELVRKLDRRIAEFAPDYDLVIVTDFGHGLIGSSTIDALTQHARFLAVNAQSNSANTGFNLITKYPRADYVCIDGPEARLAVQDRVSSLGDVARNRLAQMIDCSKIIVTQGKHGCITVESGQPVHTIPALAKSVIDTVGAGDAFLAITSPLVAAGAALNHVGFIGNVVGALKVGIVGHRTSIDKVSVIKAITALLK